MSTELARLSQAEPSEAEYDSFCATVMTSARGRWFLAEYARRHRKTDTTAVLEALRRIEASVRNAPPSQEFARVRDELRALAAAISEARSDLATTGSALTTAAKVMALLGLLEARLEHLIDPQPDDDNAAPAPPEQKLETKPEAKPDPKPEILRGHLNVVPLPEREPPRASKAAPQVAQVAFPSAELMPTLTVLPSAPVILMPPRRAPTVAAAVATVVVPAVAAPPIEFAPAPDPEEMFVPFAFEPMAQDLPELAPAKRPDAFDDVMALSAAERIALFS